MTVTDAYAERVRPQPQSSPRELGEGDIEKVARALCIANNINPDDKMNFDGCAEAWTYYTLEAKAALDVTFALHPVPPAESVRPASDTAREVWEEVICWLTEQSEIISYEKEQRWALADAASHFQERLAALPTQSPPSRVDEGSGT